MAGHIGENPGVAHTRRKPQMSSSILGGRGRGGAHPSRPGGQPTRPRCRALLSLSHTKCPETPSAGADRATRAVGVSSNTYMYFVNSKQEVSAPCRHPGTPRGRLVPSPTRATSPTSTSPSPKAPAQQHERRDEE